jgi:hypothetical protein
MRVQAEDADFLVRCAETLGEAFGELDCVTDPLLCDEVTRVA